MKKIIIITILILILITITTFSLPSATFDSSGIVLHYHLNNDSYYGESASYIYDFSGMGNNGTWYNDLDTGSGGACADGKFDCYYMFDKVGDYIDCGANKSLNITGNLTLSVWFKLNGDYTNRQTIISNLQSDGTDAGYHIEFGLTNNEFLFYHARTTVSYSSMALADDNWHHLGVVRNGTAGSWGIYWYLDGVFDETDSTAVNPGSVMGSTSIGRPGQWVGDSLKFLGSMDEIILFNRSLTADEIRELYEEGNCLNKTISHQKCYYTSAQYGSPLELSNITYTNSTIYYENITVVRT